MQGIDFNITVDGIIMEKDKSNILEILYRLQRPCYKISYNSSVIRKDSNITIEFDKSITDEDLPILKFYLTSEKNAYGVIKNEFLDANEVEGLYQNKFYF